MLKHLLTKFVNFYFGFTKTQRHGILVMLFLILVTTLWRTYLNQCPVNEPVYYASYIDFSLGQSNANKNEVVTHKTLFAFNPNTVTYDELLALGVPERVSKTLLKYRKSGAVFYKKDDLKKVYGFSQALYKQLAPYILLEQRKERVKSPNKSVFKTAKQIQILELNEADSAALVALPAIGPAFAKRIIKYRTLLGGYVRLEQLKEVYGFTDSMYVVVAPRLELNADKISRLPVNTCEFKVLCKHPYVGYELCKRIFDWRRKTILTPTNLKDILDNPSLYNKLLPYLSF